MWQMSCGTLKSLVQKQNLRVNTGLLEWVDRDACRLPASRVLQEYLALEAKPETAVESELEF